MDDYAQAFATFRTASDVVQVEAEALGGELRRRGVRSLCDVGAGPGDLAQRLAAVVDTYVAVESRPDYAAALRDLGITVIQDHWPTPLPRQYDGVVMSHVLRSRSNVDAMVNAAIDALTAAGALFVVLHTIEGSEWERLMQRIDMTERLEDDLTEAVESVFAARALVVHRRQLRTRVATDSAEAMTSALSFVASAGEPGTAREFAGRLVHSGLIEADCRRPDGTYAFDFQQCLLVAERTATGYEGGH